MFSVPKHLRETAKLWALGLTKIPVLLLVTPRIVELDDQHCVVKIGLNRRTKNHLGSMYFAVLAAGADCAGGLIAWKLIEQAQPTSSLSLIFKDFHADFLKRVEGDAHFTCADGDAIRSMIGRAQETGERQSLPVRVTATVPTKLGTEPAAQFTLTLSVKKNS